MLIVENSINFLFKKYKQFFSDTVFMILIFII